MPSVKMAGTPRGVVREKWNSAVLGNSPLADCKSEDTGAMKRGNPLAAGGRGKVRRKKLRT